MMRKVEVRKITMKFKRPKVEKQRCVGLAVEVGPMANLTNGDGGFPISVLLRPRNPAILTGGLSPNPCGISDILRFVAEAKIPFSVVQAVSINVVDHLTFLGLHYLPMHQNVYLRNSLLSRDTPEGASRARIETPAPLSEFRKILGIHNGPHALSQGNVLDRLIFRLCQIITILMRPVHHSFNISPIIFCVP